MHFIDRITVSRSGKKTNEFTHVWSEDETRSRLASSNNPHTYVEYLEGAKSSPCKFFLDRDVYLPEHELPSSKLMESHLADVRCHMQTLIDCMTTDRSHLTFRIATRHGYCHKRSLHKYSFRPFIQGMSIRYTDIPKVVTLMDQQDFWDMTVYKESEQLLACIHGCKGLTFGGVMDERVLIPEYEYDDPLWYVAQFVDPSWPLLDLPADYCPKVRVPAPQQNGTIISEETDPSFVTALVSCLSRQTADDRARWLKVAIVLKSLNQTCHDTSFEYDSGWLFQLFVEFSKKSDKFKGDQDCRKTWDSISCVQRVEKTSCGIGTLCFYALTDNPLQYTSAMHSHQERKYQLHSYAFKEGESDGNEVDEVDTLGPLRAALIKLHPAFHGITREGFSSTPIGDNRTILLQDPTLTEEVIMVLPTSVRIAGSIVGDVAPGLKIDGMHRVIPLISKVARFELCCDENGRDMTLTNETDNRSSLELYDIDHRPRGTVDIHGSKAKNMSLKDAKTIVEAVKTQLYTHVDKHLGTASGTTKMYFNVTFNQTVNNTIVMNGGQTVGAIEGGDKISEFSQIRITMYDHAGDHQLRKGGGMVYEQIDGCPCAFVQKCTYEKYINSVLRDNSVYNDNPRRFDELMKHMTNYDVAKMPWFEPDLDVLSFTNGVLQLESGVFTLYDNMEIESSLAKSVARHHINSNYTHCRDTPLLDRILDAQFSKEVATLLLALLGRMLFKINQCDGWQVMPFLVGIGGTGKSLIMNVIQRLFAPGAVGNLSSKPEEAFGMANLAGKEIVMGRDMPAKMSGALSQEQMQNMTAGDAMQISRKHLTAIDITWTAPVIMAGNHMPDYANTGGNVSRRIVSIRFDNVVTNPDGNLEKQIIAEELPQIVARCVFEYKALCRKAETLGGFWRSVPKEVTEWQNQLSASTNKLHAFLDMDDQERKQCITISQGSVTWLLDFKASFERTMSSAFEKVKFVSDPAVFARFGYRLSSGEENVCKSCKQLARGGKERCCANYEPNSRGKKKVIHNMLMTNTCVSDELQES